MKNKSEIHQALSKCDKAFEELSVWRENVPRKPNLVLPKYWMHKSPCVPEECSTREILEWVLAKGDKK